MERFREESDMVRLGVKDDFSSWVLYGLKQGDVYVKAQGVGGYHTSISRGHDLRLRKEKFSLDNLK